MLNFFRTASKTWVFKALFALLIASFAVWGIGDVSFGGAGNRVAQVGDAEVTVDDYARALQREMQSVSQRAGRRITVDEAQSAGLPQILLARLVRDAALDGEAARLGISVDDEAVRRAVMESPSFQGLDGKFDQAQYGFVLDRLGFRAEDFEADMRRSIARDLVTYAVSGAAAPAPGLAERTLAHQLEERSFSMIRLLPADAAAPEAPNDGVLKTFIDDNRAAYMRPESRAVSWLAIDPAAMAGAATVGDAELRAAYADRKAAYDMPETRVVDQLAFADTAAANAARARIDNGEASFADLVTERGLTLDDVSLGDNARATLPGALADAAFKLDAPGVAGPIATDFGPALINVRAITAARVIGFDEAAPTLRAEFGRDMAQEQAVVLAEQAADLLASGAGIKGVAADLGLTVHTAPALTVSGDAAAGPFGDDPAFVAEVFAAAPAEDRNLIETVAGGWVLVHVDAAEDAAPMQFDDARDLALMAWTLTARIDALAVQADAALADLKAGTAMADIAARFEKTPEALGPIRRDGGVGQISVDLLTKLFAADTGGAAMSRGDDGVMIGVVQDIVPVDMAAPEIADALIRWKDQLAASMAEDVYAYYAAALQDRAGATINQAALDQVVNALR
jgi:peptidyl-prolyl cis-trans isomerase D